MNVKGTLLALLAIAAGVGIAIFQNNRYSQPCEAGDIVITLREVALIDGDTRIAMIDPGADVLVEKVDGDYYHVSWDGRQGRIPVAATASPENAVGHFSWKLRFARGDDKFDLLGYRASANITAKHYEDAIADVEKILDEAPDWTYGYYLRGLACEGKKQYWSAIYDYDKVVSREPKEAYGYIARGMTLSAIGEFARGRSDLVQALRLEKDNAWGRNEMAWQLATCPNRRYRDAKAALTNAHWALTLSSDGNTLDTLAAAYAANGRFSEAVKCEQRALEIVEKSLREGCVDRLELYRVKRPYRGAIEKAD